MLHFAECYDRGKLRMQWEPRGRPSITSPEREWEVGEMVTESFQETTDT